MPASKPGASAPGLAETDGDAETETAIPDGQ